METNQAEETRVDEVHLNLHGKVLFGAISSWLMGNEPNIKLRGSKSQIEALSRTLRALKEFHEELKKPDADIKTVMKKLGVKNAEIKQFENAFGIKWPKQL